MNINLLAYFLYLHYNIQQYITLLDMIVVMGRLSTLLKLSCRFLQTTNYLGSIQCTVQMIYFSLYMIF